MRDDWAESTVGELCRLHAGAIQTGPFGSQLHVKDYRDDGPVPVIPTSCIGIRRIVDNGFPRITREKADTLSRHYVEPGDILFARRGVQATGKSAIAEERHRGWLCGTGVIRLRFGGDGLDRVFLSHVLSSASVRRWIRQHAVGSTMPNLNESIIRAIPTRIPSLRVQQAIAEFLTSLDDKIELNRQVNHTLEEMASALFKSWFVDFDPVVAKADGRRPFAMDDQTESLFPGSFTDDTGERPTGWQAGRLEDVATLDTASAKPFEHPDVEWEHYSIPAFDEGQWPATERGADIKSNKRRVPVDSVLVSKLNPRFHRCWLPDIQCADVAIASTEFMPFVPVNRQHRPFLFDLLRSTWFQGQLLERVTGTTGSRQRVKPSDAARIPIVVPPAPVLDAYSDRVRRMHAASQHHTRESRTLAGLRDLLLPKLLSGEIRLQTEHAVEGVL